MKWTKQCNKKVYLHPDTKKMMNLQQCLDFLIINYILSTFFFFCYKILPSFCSCVLIQPLCIIVFPSMQKNCIKPCRVRLAFVLLIGPLSDFYFWSSGNHNAKFRYVLFSSLTPMYLTGVWIHHYNKHTGLKVMRYANANSAHLAFITFCSVYICWCNTAKLFSQISSSTEMMVKVFFIL